MNIVARFTTRPTELIFGLYTYDVEHEYNKDKNVLTCNAYALDQFMYLLALSHASSILIELKATK